MVKGFHPKTEFKKGHKNSKEVIEKIINSRKWYKHLEQTKKKISAAKKGKPSKLKGTKFSESHRINLSKGRIGMKFSNNHIENFKRSRWGLKAWNEDEVKFIEQNMNKLNNNELANMLKRSKSSIIGKMTCSKLKRDKEVYKGMISNSSKGHKISENHRKHLSEIHLGDNNPMKNIESRKKMSCTIQGIPIAKWNGFISYEEYGRNFNKKFKDFIRKRDNQVCLNCGIHREKLKVALSIHHINYDKMLSIKENCISLCKSCHMLTNINRAYWIKQLQDKLNKLYGYEYDSCKPLIYLNNNIINNQLKTQGRGHPDDY